MFNIAISICVPDVCKSRYRHLTNSATTCHITISDLHVTNGINVISLLLLATNIYFVIILFGIPKISCFITVNGNAQSLANLLGVDALAVSSLPVNIKYNLWLIALHIGS